MDCMRLFTKEDVLDGDEKPVRTTVYVSYHFTASAMRERPVCLNRDALV